MGGKFPFFSFKQDNESSSEEQNEEALRSSSGATSYRSSMVKSAENDSPFTECSGPDLEAVTQCLEQDVKGRGSEMGEVERIPTHVFTDTLGRSHKAGSRTSRFSEQFDD